MLNRIALTRPLRLALVQRRLYTIKPSGESAEFSANKPTSNTTKYILAGATVLVLGTYAAMTAAPGKAAEIGAENDKSAVKKMNPPHRTHEGNSAGK